VGERERERESEMMGMSTKDTRRPKLRTDMKERKKEQV
jgi:hypothetical protein